MSQPKEQDKDATKEGNGFEVLKSIIIDTVKHNIAEDKKLGQNLDDALSLIPTTVRTGKAESVDLQKLAKKEEEYFALTNDFTTAGEGSVIKLRDTYRHLQHNLRAAAMREHKKLYDDVTLSLADHGMLAYNNARESLLLELRKTTEESLYQLKTETSPLQSQDGRLSKPYQLVIQSLHDDPNLSRSINHKIEQILLEEYRKITNQAPKGVPEAVTDYYSLLAKFTWDCAARPIPLIMSIDETQFDSKIHEVKDDSDDDVDNSGKSISYIYPVLFTSNNWPREVALKGKVKILQPTDET